MTAEAIPRQFQGRERSLSSGLTVISGLAVPESLQPRMMDTLVGQIADCLETQRGVMRPLATVQLRESVEEGRFAVSMKRVGEETLFLAVAQSWPMDDPSIQEVGTVMKLDLSAASKGQAAEVTREATLLAYGREGVTDIEALAATTNTAAQRLFHRALSAPVKRERLSDYVFVDGNERKGRVQMTVFDLNNLAMQLEEIV